MTRFLILIDFVPNQQRTFESFLLRLAEALRSAGWQANYVFAGEPSDAFATGLRSLGVEWRVTAFPLQRSGCDALVASLAGPAPLAMANVFVSCFSPLILSLKKRLGIKYWLVFDQASGAASPKTGLRRLLAKLRGRYYGRYIDRVLAVSEFVARRNVEESFLPKSRVRVLSNGVDLDRFHPSSMPDGPLRVVFVGQLIPEKGLRTLLQAMLILKQLAIPVTPTLEIAGSGAVEAECRAFVVDNGLHHVTFLGQVADLPALYQGASVVVVPSEWPEAFGFVVAEAMACGACVLASDAGGIPEVVGPDGVAGRLFRHGDARDLAEKLLALLGNNSEFERFRLPARARAEQLFGLDAMVQGFVRELQDVSHRR